MKREDAFIAIAELLMTVWVKTTKDREEGISLRTRLSLVIVKSLPQLYLSDIIGTQITIH